MPFCYHPPTGRSCPICDELLTKQTAEPIIDSHRGRAISASDFPFHNWYHFVLGYSPEFPLHILEKEQANASDFVLDPFMGTGTTLVCCKMKGIPSAGIDANDFMVTTARVKTCWDIDVQSLKKYIVKY